MSLVVVPSKQKKDWLTPVLKKWFYFFEQTSWCSHVDVSQHIFDMKNWSGNHVWEKSDDEQKRRERKLEKSARLWFIRCFRFKRVIYKKTHFCRLLAKNCHNIAAAKSKQSQDGRAGSRLKRNRATGCGDFGANFGRPARCSSGWLWWRHATRQSREPVIFQNSQEEKRWNKRKWLK